MSGRVLVVDDDASVLRTLVTSMTRCGHSTLAANTLVDAVALVASESVDVLLCDLHLGSESGLDVVRACRLRNGRFVFIVMLTGEDDDDTRELAAAAGADLVLAKPVSPATLRHHIGGAIAQLRTAA